jgi:8-oxo-dGTP pyrophosphatase MutT (NUDIX family)
MTIKPPDLTLEYISRRLKETYVPGVIASTEGIIEINKDEKFTCAAVLIPLVRWKNEWHFVYTRRTEAVEHHKGQVSFPGGGCEEGESNPEQTALREAEEEIGLQSKDVHLLGRLNELLTITRYRVTPVAGVIPWPYEIKPEPAEVERVFIIPLLWLANPSNWSEESFRPKGLRASINLITYHPYDGETLWGATARITHNFLSVIELLEN